MTETKVPKDIRVYKTKLFGPFTLRQIICILLAFGLDILFFKMVCKPLEMSENTMIYFLMFVDIPIIAFSFEIQGMKMERYLIDVVLRNYLVPNKRKSGCVICNTEQKEHVMDKKEQKKLEKEISGHQELQAYK